MLRLLTGEARAGSRPGPSSQAGFRPLSTHAYTVRNSRFSQGVRAWPIAVRAFNITVCRWERFAQTPLIISVGRSLIGGRPPGSVCVPRRPAKLSISQHSRLGGRTFARRFTRPSGQFRVTAARTMVSALKRTVLTPGICNALGISNSAKKPARGRPRSALRRLPEILPPPCPIPRKSTRSGGVRSTGRSSFALRQRRSGDSWTRHAVAASGGRGGVDEAEEARLSA